MTSCVNALMASWVIMAGLEVPAGSGVYDNIFGCFLTLVDRRGAALGVGVLTGGGGCLNNGSTCCTHLIRGIAPGVLFRVLRR